MRVVNETLLAEFRHRPCDECGRRPPSEAAHMLSKGMGGAYRLDVRLNLCSLCRDCHQSHHTGGRPSPADLLVKIAARECVDPDAILCELWRLRRADSDGPVAEGGEGRDGDGIHAGQESAEVGEGPGDGPELPGRGTAPSPDGGLPGVPTSSDGWTWIP